MALPHENITQIPNNEPDAVPGLWNTRYDEIDDNFSYLENQRSSHASTISALSSEITTARAGQSSLDARLDSIDSELALVSPEGQQVIGSGVMFALDQAALATQGVELLLAQQAEEDKNLHAVGSGVMFALDQAALATQGVELLRSQHQQEGEILFTNRGVIKGCTISRSTTSSRNISIASGLAFMYGRPWIVPAEINAASVPSNPGVNSETVFAYLYYDTPTDQTRVSVTPIGEQVPEHGIHIYTITIPANNTDETDQFLDEVALTSVRRIEPDYPGILSSPKTHSIIIQTLSDSDYRVDFDIVASDGEPVDRDDVRVFSRATNGFLIELATGADNVLVRWRVSKLNH